MEDCMRICMRKLALWYTKTFRVLTTHDELEPILATMGFVGLPPNQGTSGVAWKEYVFKASPGVSRRSKSSSCFGSTTAGEPPTTEPPRPKLPYPRIDGLHIYTYRAFLDAVNFYLEMYDISELFHIRGMPLHPRQDRSRRWRCMEEDDSIFVFWEGTLEQTTYNLYHLKKQNSSSSSSTTTTTTTTTATSNGSCNRYSSVFIRDKGNNTPISCFVSLKDIMRVWYE